MNLLPLKNKAVLDGFICIDQQDWPGTVADLKAIM